MTINWFTTSNSDATTYTVIITGTVNAKTTRTGTT